MPSYYKLVLLFIYAAVRSHLFIYLHMCQYLEETNVCLLKYILWQHLN